MSTTMLAICSFSIFIAGLLAIYRIREILIEYKPFVYLIWIGCANEIISAILIHYHRPTFVNNNLYILAEGLLYAWQYYKWKFISPRIFYLLFFGQLMLWLIETYNLGIDGNIARYSIVHSFIIMLCAIKSFSVLIISTDKPLTNAGFLISVGCIIFFFFNTVVEASWLFGQNFSSSFRNQIFYTIVYVNVAVNLIFAAAILWIPKKPIYITL